MKGLVLKNINQYFESVMININTKPNISFLRILLIFIKKTIIWSYNMFQLINWYVILININ